MRIGRALVALRRVSLLVALVAAAPTRAQAATLYVGSGGSLQTALNAAQPGDDILLEPGATFTGNFVLPVKAGTAPITIQTALSGNAIPPAGERLAFTHVPALAKIRSGNTSSALRTAPGAHHWRLRLLEFQANKDGYGDIVMIGDGSSAQRTLADVPHDIEIDQVYVHGDPLVGQKRGIALNASAVTIRNSVITDCKAVGMEAQAIAGWNGPGPYLIDNNYLEGAAENVLFGGADPSIPGLAASDIVFTRNHLTKPLAWRDPIIPAPADLTAALGAGGTLPTGRVSYRVVARRRVGQATMGRSTAAAIDVDIPLNATVRLQWQPVPHATEYQVFGRGFVWTASTPSFTDTGAAGVAASPPSGAGSRWVVKNIFELKNARRVRIERNLFETNWQDGQTGYAIVFTPRNSGGTCTWCAIEDVTFEFNVVRHVAAGINILGYDTLPRISGQASNIRIRHNLFSDISGERWGGNGWFLLLGDEPRDVTVEHNTIDHAGGSLVYVYGGTASSPRTVRGFRFSNNIARHGQYGLSGAFFAYGSAVLAAYFPDALIDHNLLSGGSPSRYPVPNYFHTDFLGLFTNASSGDYCLTAASAARGLASDGTDLGADMTTLLAGLARVPQPDIAPQTFRAPGRPSNLRLIR